ELFEQIWSSQPDPKTVGAYGIREVTTDPYLDVDGEARYPTNAYHTYWATTSLRRVIDTTWAPDHAQAHLAAGADRLRLIAGEQMALLAAGSSFADPQQLAWAVTGIVHQARPTDLAQGGRVYHVVRQGLRQFFEQQDDRGEW